MREGSAGLMAPAAPLKPAKPKTVVKPAAAAAPAKAQWYRVLQTVTVPRHGGTFELHAGKEISSANFDIKAIERAGGKVEKIAPPQHWIDTQTQSLAEHEGRLGHEDTEMRAALAAQGVPGLVDAPADTAPAA